MGFYKSIQLAALAVILLAEVVISRPKQGENKLGLKGKFYDIKELTKEEFESKFMLCMLLFSILRRSKL